MKDKADWPDGKQFAFTIFDDTDRSTLANAPHVYDFLADRGFRTTKSVWPSAGTQAPSIVGGDTCAEKDYLNWVQQIQSQGFEIAYHNNTYHTSTRAEVEAGLDRFQQFFGHYPRSMANHTEVLDGMYWGHYRLSGLQELIYLALTRFRNFKSFGGHRKDSPYFWGDHCQKRIKYCRNFVFGDINTLGACPWMPYHDPDRPYVNYWFASTDGADVDSFNRALSEANQDRLEQEGGACIMYTHLGKNFYSNGEINPRFNALMDRLSKKNGWFVPVTTLLDHLLDRRADSTLTAGQRRRLELGWLVDKIRRRGE